MWEMQHHWAGWGRGGDNVPWAGYQIEKPDCSDRCRFVGNRDAAPIADVLIYEPQQFGKAGRRYPEKKVCGQKYMMFSYETVDYFAIQGDSRYLSQKPVAKLEDKKKFAVFVASNCVRGGADKRTEYVKELMQYIEIDSFGLCLQNQPADALNRNTDRERYLAKMELMKEYKFVLAFENGNTTDYVTEKLFQAYLGKTLPVYMGANNVEDWTPGNHSVIRTDQFKSPKDLADYLLKVGSDQSLYEEYFKWKNEPFKPQFYKSYDNCVFQTECRLCDRVIEERKLAKEAGYPLYTGETLATSGTGAPEIFSGYVIEDLFYDIQLYSIIAIIGLMMLYVRPTAIFHSVSGNFSGGKAIEIIVSHGRSLEMLRPDDNGKLESVCYTEVFGIVRSIIPFRLTSGTKDYVIVGSDSGRVVILEYNPMKNVFDKVHQETFGRSGCRRIVPGQYLATDPRGRAFMIGAIEKQKLVYILNRDSTAKLTISSPLEAHKSHTILFGMVGVDVGFDNPIFATLSVDYSEEVDMDDIEDVNNKKMLTFYELDLGLNNVVRKWSEEVDASANLLMAVPGGSDGPGGVLVASEGCITYKNIGHQEIRAAIPRRAGSDHTAGLMIVTHSSHKQKDMFFILVQSEYGDLYKISLVYEGETVSDIIIAYFDTIPVANALSVLKSGFLFAASEFGDHALYHFQSLGPTEDGDPEFVPRAIDAPQNLLLTGSIDSLAPILDFKVADLVKEESAQMYALTGVGQRAGLRVLRHGLPVTQMAGTALPGIPSGIWTVPHSSSDPIDKYIIVSFIGSTLVLSVGETVEEVTDSGVLATTTTLLVRPLSGESIVQVHPHGIRHIKADRRVNEWRAPGRKTIMLATANSTQVVVALSGGELIYFEIDAASNLTEVLRRDLRREVSSLEIAPIPRGRQMARFLAISDWEGPVRILSLDRDNCLNQVSMLDTEKVSVESLSLVEMQVHEAGVERSSTGPASMAMGRSGTLFLSVGLKNGVMKRSLVDALTGELSDTRTRLLGRKAVKFFRIKVKGNNALLALSSRVWLCYSNNGKFEMTPLSVEPLDNVSSFCSDQCPEGIVSTSENNLKIFSIEKLGDLFNQVTIPLACTPRRFIVHPQTNYIITIETEHNYSTDHVPVKNASEEVKMEDDEDKQEEEVARPKAGAGKWRSSIRVIDPHTNATLDLVELQDNEAAFSLCTCIFHDKDGEIMLAVGCGKDVMLKPKSCSSASIRLYRFTEGGRRLQLIYATPVEEVAYAMQSFHGRLLVGVAHMLRLYEMGKKKLLRKCENKSLPNHIVSLHAQGDRVVVGDVQESFHFIKYKKVDNQLYVFADDTAPRFITASAMLDYDTVAGADKFGNIFVTRLPASVSDEVEDDPTGSKLRFETGHLNGAPHKLETVINFYVGDTVNHLSKTPLVVGGAEVLLYTTLGGAIGALIPFVSREDVDFFSTLEMQMRQEHQPLCGRDHLAYRSYYFPLKNVIDGDLCEQFTALDATKQRAIAEELSRTPSEVLKKLEDLRSQRLL
eukprot:gene1533-1790_t